MSCYVKVKKIKYVLVHIVKAYGGVEVWLQSFLILVVDTVHVGLE